MYLKTATKKALRTAFEWAGLEISKQGLIPKKTYLGLSSLPVRTVLDIGANKGQFLAEAAKVFPNARFYCFEPLPDAFAVLVENIAAQQLQSRTTPINAALGDTEETSTIYLHEDHNASSSLLRGTETLGALFPITGKQKEVPVTVRTLDAMVEDGSVVLNEPLVIKMDVQGFEDRVIRGGTNTFSKAQACIIEINFENLYEEQPSFNSLYLQLSKLGFEYRGNIQQTYKPNGEVIFIDAVFFRS